MTVNGALKGGEARECESPGRVTPSSVHWRTEPKHLRAPGVTAAESGAQRGCHREAEGSWRPHQPLCVQPNVTQMRFSVTCFQRAEAAGPLSVGTGRGHASRRVWAPGGGQVAGRRPPSRRARPSAPSKCSLAAASGFSLSPEAIRNHICYFAI